jgi:hypothetical protein
MPSANVALVFRFGGRALRPGLKTETAFAEGAKKTEL